MIKGIVDVFGIVRFIISDDTLRDLINKIWTIHKYELSILQHKMNYLEEPSDREKQWLERVVGKEANRIIRGANLKRLSTSEDKKVKEMRDGIEYENKHVEGFKRYVSEKYGKVIEEYSFPTDLIEGICIESVFH